MYAVPAKVTVPARKLIASFEKGEIVRETESDEEEDKRPNYPEMYARELAPSGTAAKRRTELERLKREAEAKDRPVASTRKLSEEMFGDFAQDRKKGGNEGGDRLKVGVGHVKVEHHGSEHPLVEYHEVEHLGSEHTKGEHQEVEHQIVDHPKVEDHGSENHKVEHHMVEHPKVEHHESEHTHGEHHKVEHHMVEQPKVDHHRFEHKKVEHQKDEHQKVEHPMFEFQRVELRKVGQYGFEHQKVEQQKDEHQKDEHHKVEHPTVVHQRVELQKVEHPVVEHHMVELPKVEQHGFENQKVEHTKVEHQRDEQQKDEHDKVEHPLVEFQRVKLRKVEQHGVEHPIVEHLRVDHKKVGFQGIEHQKDEHHEFEHQKVEHQRTEHSEVEHHGFEHQKDEHQKVEQTKAEHQKGEHHLVEHPRAEASIEVHHEVFTREEGRDRDETDRGGRTRVLVVTSTGSTAESVLDKRYIDDIVKTFKDDDHEVHVTDLNHDKGHHVADYSVERERLWEAQLVVFHFRPVLHTVPAGLLHWFQNVLTEPFAFDRRNGKTFENGLMKGKRSLLVVTLEDEKIRFEGNSQLGDFSQYLWPIQNGILRYVGFSVLTPHLTFGLNEGSHDAIIGEATQTLASRLRNVWHEKPLFQGHE